MKSLLDNARRSPVNIVVKGRNVEVPDHYRMHVTEKLARVWSTRETTLVM